MGYDPRKQWGKGPQSGSGTAGDLSDSAQAWGDTFEDMTPRMGGTPAAWQKKTNVSSATKGVDQMMGTQGGMDTSGRGQVEPIKNSKGEPWDFSKDADPNQKSAEQANQDKLDTLQEQLAESRALQNANIEQLQAASRGEGPSAAQDQLQLATDQNMRQSLAMAASGRGNAALALQGAGRERAIMGQQLVSQSGALRAQEMQSAQVQLSQAIQAQRQQDLITDQNVISREKIASAEQMTGMQVNMSKSSKGDPLGIGLSWSELGQIGITYVTIAAYFSDERVKTDIEEITDGEVDEFFNAFTPKSFKYRNPEEPGQSAGSKVGLMAQDVRDTKLGKMLFSRSDDGMSILDPQVLMGIMMAGMKKIMEGQKHGNN